MSGYVITISNVVVKPDDPCTATCTAVWSPPQKNLHPGDTVSMNKFYDGYQLSASHLVTGDCNHKVTFPTRSRVANGTVVTLLYKPTFAPDFKVEVASLTLDNP